jgi:serine/threonine protein kinase
MCLKALSTLLDVFTFILRQVVHEFTDLFQVAIKEIQISRGNDKSGTNKAWEDEARALAGVNELDHDHIIRCVAAIRRGDNRYFMFPWADGGSLRDYWDNAKWEGPTRKMILEAVQQLRGLADALVSLHNNIKGNTSRHIAVDSDDEESATNPSVRIRNEDNEISKYQEIANVKHIRHGDLKPENILRFVGHNTGLGTLKIADMGIAKQHIVATQDRRHLTSTRHGTIRYEAPEIVDVNSPRSRLYDIWSMGCITLEFIIWILYGNDELENFYVQVQGGDKQRLCQYYEVLNVEQAQRAEIHPVVLNWMTHIEKHDRECKRKKSAIHDILTLVREKLLVVPLPPNRASNTSGGRRFAAPELGQTLARYRANAVQFRDALDDIIAESATEGYLLLEGDRENMSLPRLRPSISSSSSSSTNTQTREKNEPPDVRVLQLRSPTGILNGLSGTYRQPADYTLPPMREWEFSVDNLFAESVRSSVGPSAMTPTQRTQSKLCNRCQALDFWGASFQLEDTLTALSLRAERCDLCNLINKVCNEKKVIKNDILQIVRKQSSLMLTGDPYPVLSIVRSPGTSTFPAVLYTLISCSNQRLRALLTTRSLGFNPPLSIQLGFPELPRAQSEAFYLILQLWLRNCNEDEAHKGCRSHISNSLPTRLIDVGPNLRLVETKEERLSSSKYIALSHPWGDTRTYEPFSTLRKNIESFKKAIPYDRLPLTFKDAVDCSRRLGVQYLWIDSICIIQGLGGDFNEEAKKMEDVFSGAYCVLAASRASSQQDGFLGSRQHRDYVTLGDERPFYICKMIDNFNRDVIEGPLNKRGWVLQERALARRTIYFTASQTYFECGNGVRCETLTSMKK